MISANTGLRRERAPAASLPHPARPRRVTIVTSRAGAGHDRAAEAAAEGLRQRFGDRVVITVVDAVKDYAPFPLRLLPELYAHWIRNAAATYGWGHRITDGPKRTALFLRAAWPLLWPYARRLLLDETADAILCVHSLENHFLAWARRRLGLRTAIVTLVTDPVSAHAVWLSPDVDLCLVGSESAAGKAVAAGVPRERVRVTGLPVNPAYVRGLMRRADARAMLGWHPHRPAALLIGGGDGVGGLDRLARALDVACREVQIAVVTGRNRSLLERMRRGTFRSDVHLYGFVDHANEMSALMSAADLLLTKAGPGTLHDAFLARLPIILTGAIPSQEDGNVAQVLEAEAGVWAPEPRTAAGLARTWLEEDRAALSRFAARSGSLAMPEAADAVARAVWTLMDARGGAGTGTSS